MGKVNEPYVRDTAIHYLKEYYLKEHFPEIIYSEMECVVSHKGRHGRADGLLGFNIQGGKTFIVSIEAKSHKTISCLRKRFRENLFLTMKALVFLLVSSISFLLLRYQAVWFRVFFCFLLGIFMTHIINQLLMSFRVFDTLQILEQIKKYPGNEKWIALSSDMYRFYSQCGDDTLIVKARRTGIGILTVSAGRRVHIILKPKRRMYKLAPSPLRFYSCRNRMTECLVNK